MRERADVVVAGAGVIGASVAWHLTELGVRDVLIVDRAAAVGEGST
jgi:sarcosine oxidase, subunit beta